jgi:hypothetical protein
MVPEVSLPHSQQSATRLYFEAINPVHEFPPPPNHAYFKEIHQFFVLIFASYVNYILTFSVRHLNAIKSTAGRSFLGIKHLPALQQM